MIDLPSVFRHVWPMAQDKLMVSLLYRVSEAGLSHFVQAISQDIGN